MQEMMWKILILRKSDASFSYQIVIVLENLVSLNDEKLNQRQQETKQIHNLSNDRIIAEWLPEIDRWGRLHKLDLGSRYFLCE